MASFIICNSPLSTFRRNSITTRPSFQPQCFIQTPYLRVSGDWYQRRRRGSAVVTRAGPSSTSYIFAFVFPLSLLAITIFTSIRIADKLDKKFYEEVLQFPLLCPLLVTWFRLIEVVFRRLGFYTFSRLL